MKILPHCTSAAILGIAATLPFGTVAQAFPDKPVRVLMPFPVGADPNTVMRMIGERLTQKWEQTVIIEPVPAATRSLP